MILNVKEVKGIIPFKTLFDPNNYSGVGMYFVNTERSKWLVTIPCEDACPKATLLSDELLKKVEAMR